MKKVDTVILGAGIAGMSAAHFLNESGIECVVYEQNSYYGGLCNSFEIEGFRFDTFAHVAFSKNSIVNALFEEQTDYVAQTPEASNYYKGSWLRNPVQNNLYGLEVRERIKVITDFVDRNRDIKIKNYEDWLRSNYGDYFAENFPMKYTKKYWTVEAAQMETKWIQNRMYTPNLEEILMGAMTDSTPCVHYTKEIHYPLDGGFKSFLKPLARGIIIEYNKKVAYWDLDNKTIRFGDKTEIQYNHVISTLPLPELENIILRLPVDIKAKIQTLDYTSGAMVSIGLNKIISLPSMWFYIYDTDIYPARIYSPNKKSINNVPAGTSAIQAEIYYSKYKPLKLSLDQLRDETVQQLESMGLFTEDDIVVKDIRMEQYANIIFTPEIYQSRDLIKEYLMTYGVISAGRFGEWDYLWTDQSLLSGKKGAEELLGRLYGR